MVYMYLLLSAVLIAIDQLIKNWAVSTLMNIKTIPLIENIFHLTYVKNFGAAFSILQNKTIFLVIVTSIALIFAIWLIITKKIQNKLLLLSTSFILAGGIGNLIDRVTRGFVVDYFDFRLIRFPVFNFADCLVVVGTILIVIYMFFIEGKKSESTNKKIDGENKSE